MKPTMPDRAVARAEDQLRCLLTENLERFRAFAQSRLGDPELAADVFQDAHLRELEPFAHGCLNCECQPGSNQHN